MKKILSLALAAVLAVGCLSGCGSKGEDYSAVTKDGKIRLIVGNWADEDANSKGYEAAMKKKEAFEAKYPDIEVVPNNYAYSVETFAPRAEGKTLPTIYVTHFTEAKKIIDLGYSADVTEKFKEYGYDQCITDVIANEISRDGKFYLIPQDTYSLGLVMNLNLFREAGLMNADGTPMFPKTFDEVREMAKTIHDKTGKAGFVFPTTSNGGGWNFTCLAWNFGGTFMKELDDGTYEADFNEGTTYALQWLKDMMWEDGSLPATTLINNTDTVKMIGTDQAAMCFANTEQLRQLVASYDMDTANIGFAAMPAGVDEPITLMGGTYYAIANNATEEQIDAAFKWMQFTGTTPATELTEDMKSSIRSTYQTKYEEGTNVIGVKDLTVWSDKEVTQAYKNELIEEFRNIDEKNVSSFNNKGNMKFQTEEKMNAQDLYALLDSAIQEVLTNKDADCATVLEDTEYKFQNSYLNK